MKLTLHVNDQDREVDVDPDTPLLWVLREDLRLTGTRFGCGAALCGACTVHLDGRAVRSCVLPVGDLGGQKVHTIESLGGAHPVQVAWCEANVPQCGYCQSGQVMAAAALLASRPKPTREDIDLALSGNICRCGTYPRIRLAIERAAESIASRAVPDKEAP
jgi:aerobic-type carbon monoxide dehydrogenase small subunit (CoxS/CutS family)